MSFFRLLDSFIQRFCFQAKHFIVFYYKIVVSHEEAARGLGTIVGVRQVRVGLRSLVALITDTQICSSTKHRAIPVREKWKTLNQQQMTQIYYKLVQNLSSWGLSSKLPKTNTVNIVWRIWTTPRLSYPVP